MKVVRIKPAVTPAATLADGDPDVAMQLALSYAAVALPALRRWHGAKAAARAALDAAEATVARTETALVEAKAAAKAAETTLPALRTTLEQAEAELQAVERRPWPLFRFIWMWFWGKAWREQRDAAQAAVGRAREGAESSGRDAAAKGGLIEPLETRLAGDQRRLSAAKAEAERLGTIPKAVSGLRFVDYVWWPVLVQESETPTGTSRKWVFADAYGTPRKLTIPIVGMDEKDIAKLEEDIGGLNFGDVLLDPKELRNEFGKWGTLLGSEQDLIDVARGITAFVRGIQPVELRFATTPAATSTGTLLQEFGARLRELGGKAVEPLTDEYTKDALAGIQESAATLRKAVGANRRKTTNFYTSIAKTAEGLLNSITQATKDRAGSAHLIGDRIKASRLDSVLVRYHIFCPQCNATPPYLKEVCEIKPEDIDDMRTSELEPRVDAYLRRRLNSKEGKRHVSSDAAQQAIEEGWQAAFADLKNLERLARNREAEVAKLAHDDRAPAKLFVRLATREIRVYRAWFRQALRTLVRRPFAPWKDILGPEAATAEGQRGGTANGPADSEPDLLNPNTRLTYEPQESPPWRCPFCNSEYTTEHALLGSIDRLRWEVAYPTVRALWGHESVWSKTLDALADAGREMRDRVEQEIKALQGPIDNFRADARTLRARLDEANARGRAVRDRLDDIETQYERLGLLTTDQLSTVQTMRDKVASRVELIGSVRDRLDVSETDLEKVIQKVYRERALPAAPASRFIEADAAKGLVGRRGIVQAGFTILSDEAGSELWSCARCGVDNTTGGKFCTACGAPRSTS